MSCSKEMFLDTYSKRLDNRIRQTDRQTDRKTESRTDQHFTLASKKIDLVNCIKIC